MLRGCLLELTRLALRLAVFVLVFALGVVTEDRAVRRSLG
jgi:hypothetical protein